MFFTRLSTHASRTFSLFVNRAETVAFTKSTPQAFGSLTQSLTAPRLAKLPRASLVPGVRFFQSHLIRKSLFPHHQQSDFRVFGVLAAVGLLAVSKKVSCNQDSDEVNLDDLPEKIAESLSALEALRDKEPVLFIGATDSGKSTTLNVMMGIPIQIVKVDSMGFATLKADHPDPFEIGNSSEAKTELVKAKQEPDSKMWLTDCPGYKDNRSKTRHFVSDISSYLATQTVRKVKAIVVTISIGAFDQRGNAFKEIALMLHHLIHNSPAARQSIFFMFTKSPIRQTTDSWGNRRYQVYPADKGEIVDRIKNILQVIEAKPENELSKEDKAARNVIELMIKGDIEGDGSQDSPQRTSPEGARIFVIDISNRNQRKEILDAIAKAPGIERDQFNPNINGDVAESFKKSIIKRLEMGSQLGEMYALRDQESDLRLTIEGTHTEISRIDDQIRYLQKGTPLNITQYSEVIVDQIHNYKEIEELLTASRDRIETEIQENDTTELVDYWRDRFFSEPPFLDFFSRKHVFHYKLKRPFSEVFDSERSSQNMVWKLITGLAMMQNPIAIPGLYLYPNGEHRVIKISKETGEFESEYEVLKHGVTADFTVTIQGPKNGREDVALLLTTLRRDLDLVKARLEKLATEKSQAEDSLKNVTALCSSLQSLTSQKSILGKKIDAHQEELRRLQNQLTVLEEDIRKNKKALTTALSLIQFDLINSILNLNQNLVSNFTKKMAKLKADPKFQEDNM